MEQERSTRPFLPQLKHIPQSLLVVSLNKPSLVFLWGKHSERKKNVTLFSPKNNSLAECNLLAFLVLYSNKLRGRVSNLSKVVLHFL